MSEDQIAAITQTGAGFDYTSLDLNDQEMTRVIAERDKVRALFARSQDNFIEIGHALINVKEILRHGEFGGWLDVEFGWSKATAGRFMQVAAQFPEITHVEHFEPSALYMLAAKTVPDDVRDHFLDQADAGHPVKLQDVREAISKTRKPKAEPTVREDVAEIVRLMDRAYTGRGSRTTWGFDSAVSPHLFEQEIAEYQEEDQPEIARALDAVGEACRKAAAPYLEGR